MSTIRALISRLGFVLLLAAMVSTTACSKKQKDDESATPGGSSADENVLGDSDSGKAMGLQTVAFGLDSYLLDDSAKAALNSNANILKDRTSVRIQIEGHCDERGGIQYNIALGEKRANSVKKFLSDQGIASDRMTTISYGKERPIAMGSGEEAWAKNRRANFVITSR